MTDYFDRSAQNNFSFWFPKVEHCGIRVPKSVIFKTPEDIISHFYMEDSKNDLRAIRGWVDAVVEPGVREAGLSGAIFVKNGTFSNKFEAEACFCSTENLAYSIASINYQALCVDAGGLDELVVRARIPHDRRKTPCIYGGLPLRPEFRVFYDFDIRTVLFSVNYWDYNYVFPHLYDATDKIVFQHERPRLEYEFKANKQHAEDLIRNRMAGVSGLEGPWSADLLQDDYGQFWLIDMAVAERSAYWEFRPGNEKALEEAKAKKARATAEYRQFAAESAKQD